MKNTFLTLAFLLISSPVFAFTGTKFYRLHGYNCNACVAVVDFKQNVPVSFHRFNWGDYGNTSVNESVQFDAETGNVLRYRTSSNIFLYVNPSKLENLGYGFITRNVSGALIEKK